MFQASSLVSLKFEKWLGIYVFGYSFEKLEHIWGVGVDPGEADQLFESDEEQKWIASFRRPSGFQ